MTYVLTGASSSTTACGWCSCLSIGALGVFLLDVSVKSWVAEVSFGAIVTFKVASLDIVLRSSLALACAILVTVLIVVFATIVTASGIHVASLCVLTVGVHALAI